MKPHTLLTSPKNKARGSREVRSHRRAARGMTAFVATLSVLLSSFASAPQASFAAQGPNPYAQATIGVEYDGTGHGTPAQTFITTAQGYSPGDDTPDDRVVASGDVVGYKVRVNIEAGPERVVDVAVVLPEHLRFDRSLNTHLCVSNQFVTGVLTGPDSAPMCQYSVKRGVPVTIETNLRVRGADTAGAARADQVVQVTVAQTGQPVFASDAARGVTVVSAPMADLTVRPSECAVDSTCSGVSLNPATTSGSFEIETWKLRKQGLANDKGASNATGWTAGLDVSSFPAGTVWNVGGSPVSPVSGVLPLRGNGNIRVSYSVPANWGGAEFTDGEVRDFPVHLVVPTTAFSTTDYLNNGDGWQPGSGATRDESTANVRESGAQRGWRFANNDYTFVRVLKPIPTTPAPGINFNKSLVRPWNGTQTLFEPGNMMFAESSPTVVNHRDYVDRVAEGTEILTNLTIFSQQVESETPLRVTVADHWDPALFTATGPVTVTDAAGASMTTGYTVYWSRTATGASVPDANVTAGWVASPEPLSGARAVRVVFDALPVGAIAGAGMYTVQVPHRVADTLPRPLPSRITDIGGVQIGNTLGRTVTEYLVPVSADTWLPSVEMTAGSEPQVELDRENSQIKYTFTPKVNGLALSTAPITGAVTVTLDPCITRIELASAGWDLKSVVLGSGCGTDNPVPGTMVLQPAGGSFDPSGKVNSRSVTLPPVVFDAKVSQLAEPVVSTSASWQMTGQGPHSYSEDSVPPANAYRTIGAESVLTVTAELSTTTPRQEVGDPLRFNAVVYGRGSDTVAANTQTVIVLPGKGDDGTFLDVLEGASGNQSYQDDEDNPLASAFHGSYTLSSAIIRAEDSVEGTVLLCTTKTNPNFDPEQAGANWSPTCGPNTTAMKIVQPGGDNQGISAIAIELLPVGDRANDVFLTWIGPIYVGETAGAMAWPVADTIVSSTVSGIVYWDESGIGSNWVDPWPGIEDARLDLLDSDGVILESTTTDSDGRYEFTGLHSRSGVQVRVSGTPTVVPSASIPGSEDRVVKQTYSYNAKRLAQASPQSTVFEIPVAGVVSEVNFGFFAADPYTDLKKDVSNIVCGETGTVCDVEWDVTVRNGGNTTLTEGVFTDVTSTRVYDVSVAGVRQLPAITVADVAAGAEHSLVLTKGGEVYSFGTGQYGRLGHGDLANRTVPTKIAAFEGIPITAVAAGAYTSFALSEAGEVYGFGYGLNGELGLPATQATSTPTKIEAFNGTRVVAIAAGYEFTLALTEAGEVFAFGNNESGQIGFSDLEPRTTPTKIEALAGIEVVAIAAGYHHSLVLTAGGEVYSFGNPGSGQLGRDGAGFHWVPTKIQALNGITVTQIAAGRSHSLVLTNTGDVYSFGLGFNGRLGHGDGTAEPLPRKITASLNGIPIQEISAGSDHSVVLSRAGNVYTFGTGANGRLGQGSVIDWYQPERVASLNSENISGISAGGAHTLFLTENNEVYSVGNAGSGRLGQGPGGDIATPTVISGFSAGSPRDYGGLSPVSVTPRGGFTERVFKVPTLQPGEDVVFSVRGKVNRPAPVTGAIVGNQAWFTATETPRVAPTLTPDLPVWDSGDPSGAGKWAGNSTCTATADWVTPGNGVGGDACDQVYAAIAPSATPLGGLSGFVWEDADKDGAMGNTSLEQRMPNTPVKLWRGAPGEGTIAGETFTDSQGYYVFADLEPGSDYYVTFHPGAHPTSGKSWGYTTTANACPTVERSCANTTGVTPNVLVVAPGTTSDVNAGLVAYAADLSVTKGHLDAQNVLSQDFTAEYEVSVPVTVTVQNTGEEPLHMLRFSDVTLTGDTVAWTSCLLGTEEFIFPTPAVFPTELPETWELAVNGKFTCSGVLPGMTGTQLSHSDVVTIDGIGSITGSPVTDDSEFVTRTAVPPVEPELLPAITLEKGVLEGDELLKTATLGPEETPTITFQVRNTGEEDLLNLRLEDTTMIGDAHVTAIECEWPQIVIGGNSRNVLFADPDDGPTGVDCTGTLTALGLSATHMNLAEVFAIGATSNTVVSDYSEFEAVSQEPHPGISLVKSNDRVGENLAVGDVVTYTFVVANTGNVPLKDVSVAEIEFTGHGTVPVPVCSAAEAALLAPGAQLVCEAQYTLTQADVDQGEVFNSAVAGGKPQYPGNPTPEEPIETPPSNTVVGSDPEPSIMLVKTADRERYATVGEKVTYTFRVTNTGNVSLKDPKVIETEFNGVSDFLTDPVCPVSPNPLLPGQFIDCTATYTVQAADLDRESLVNVAIAEGTPPGPNPDVPEPPVQSPPATVTVVPVLPGTPPAPEQPSVTVTKLVKTGMPNEFIGGVGGVGGVGGALLVLGALTVLLAVSRRKQPLGGQPNE